MKMRKFVALAAVASMLIGSLAGCSGTTDETAGGAAGDDAIQNLINATTGTVSLTVWASEEDQAYTQGLIDEFIALYPDVTFDIQLGSESESTCKDTVLTDIEAAADVFTFADDRQPMPHRQHLPHSHLRHRMCSKPERAAERRLQRGH